MKYPRIIFSFLAMVMVSLPARADHHDVFIHDVLLLDANTCAVELWISEDGQNGFEGTDRIEINGVQLASIGDTEAAAINAGGNTNTGDSILFASNDFVAETVLEADVEFANSNCPLFLSGAVFTFVIDDPLFGGPDAIIDSVTLPSGFIANFSAFRGSASASPSLLNLDDQTVIVANNSGANVELGTSPDSGGCQLGSAAAPHFGWMMVGITCLSLGFLRRITRRRN